MGSYRLCICLLLAAALRAISSLSADQAESRKTLTAQLVTIIGLTELIRWQTLRRQNAYLAALHEIALGLMNHLDLAELLEAIVGRATQLVNASFGWLYLVDPARDVVEVKVATDTLRPWGGTRLQCGEGLAGQVWLHPPASSPPPVSATRFRRSRQPSN